MPGLDTEDYTHKGQHTFTKPIVQPTGSIGDTDIAAAAGVKATKLQQQYHIPWSQPNTTATSVTQSIYRATGLTGSIASFSAGSIGIAVGAATVTIDLKKNGTTVLSAVITLDTSNTTRVGEAATVSVPAYSVNDEFEIVVVATASGGTIPTGLFVDLVVNEDPR